MTGSFDEHLSRQLEALGADVSGVRMAGVEAARRRAAQRTRNQITGGVLASVAVVALGLVGGTQDELFTGPEPAETPETEAPTAVPTTPDDVDNTESPAPDPDDTTVPEAALITIDDIIGDTDVEDPPEWIEDDATQVPFVCAPTVPDGATHAYYKSDRDRHFLQFAETTNDPVRRFSQLRADLESCLRNLAEEARPDTTDSPAGRYQAWAINGVGEEALTASYWSRREQPTEGDGLRYDLVAVHLARAGSYVTMVIDGFPSNEAYAADTLTELAATAVDRLCGAVGEECVNEVQPTPLYPEPTGDVPGWLTIDDITAATDLDQIATGGEVMSSNDEDGPAGWGLYHLPLDPAAEGATSFQHRSYSDHAQLQDEGQVQILDQETAVFPDAETARQHYDGLLAALDNPREEGTEIENIGSASDDGYTATVWQERDDAVTFIWGLLVQGRAVTLIYYVQGEDTELTSDQMLDLLDRAAVQLAEPSAP